MTRTLLTNNKIHVLLIHLSIEELTYLQWDNHSMYIFYRIPSLIHKVHPAALMEKKEIQLLTVISQQAKQLQ